MPEPQAGPTTTPDDPTVQPAAPAAPAAGAKPEAPEVAPNESKDEAGEPEARLDVSQLPQALQDLYRSELERGIKEAAPKHAEELLRKEQGRWGWIPKEERERFEREPKEYERLKSAAADAEALRREVEELRRARQEPEAPRRPEPEAPPTQIDRVAEAIKDLEKEYEVTPGNKLFAHRLLSTVNKWIGDAQEQERRERAEHIKNFDRHLGERELAKPIVQGEVWRDPNMGPGVQAMAFGVMKAAEQRGEPIPFHKAAEIAMQYLEKIRGPRPAAAEPPKAKAPTATAAPPQPKPPARPLGDMTQGASVKGVEPEFDVHDDEAFYRFFSNLPEVQQYEEDRVRRMQGG